MPSCIPAMRSWKIMALAMMAQAMRRVWGTLSMPSRAAMSVVMPDWRVCISSRMLAASLMPCSRIVGGLVHGVLGTETRRTRSARLVTEPSSQPDCGKRATDPPFLGEDAVTEGGFVDGLGQVEGVADGFGVAQGDGGLDGTGLPVDVQIEALPGFRLDILGRVVLGFDDHRGPAGCRDEDVGLESGVALDDLGVLGAHRGLAQHTLQEVAEGVVGAGFGLVGHCVS